MSKPNAILTTLILLVAAGSVLAAPAKYGDGAFYVDGGLNDTHDDGLYILKLTNQMYFYANDNPTGLYPGATGLGTLYLGSLWVGTNAWGAPRVSGSLPYETHKEWVNRSGLLWSDANNWNQRPSWVTKRGTLDSYVEVDDSDAQEKGPIGLIVGQHGMQWSTPAAHDDYIIFQTRIENNSGRALNNTFVTFYTDLDIGGSLSYIDDLVGINTSRKMPYMYDNVANHPYVGLRILEGKPHTLGIPDIMGDPQSDAERWKIMTSGEWMSSTEPYDWRLVLSSGPHAVANNDTFQIGYAIVAGANLAAMLANADAAYNRYWNVFLSVEKFYARGINGGVEVNWEPQIEYAGFNLYRSGGDAAETRINDTPITGQKPYRFVDAAVEPSTTYQYRLEALRLGGGSEWFGPVEATTTGARATSFALAQNQPNPARGVTTMAFTLPEKGTATITIYDLAGRRVATAVDGQFDAGRHAVAIPLTNLNPGVYIYRLDAAGMTATRKMVVAP